MKSFWNATLLMLLSTTLSAQVSDQLTLLANWDVDTLPMSGSYSYNDCWGFTDCEGREYAILGSAGYSHFFDVTDPTEPVELASFLGGDVTTWRDYKTYRKRAYGVCDNCLEGLQIFDISNPQDTIIRTAQTTEFWLRSHNIFIDEEAGRLYSVGTDAVNNGVVILNLNVNPNAPLLLANLPLPGGYVHDIYVRNNIAFCSHGFNGLYIYDLSDPNNPITLGTITDYPEAGYNHASWLSEDGDYLIMADESFNRGLKYIDVSDYEDPQVVDVFRSTLEAPNDTTSIAHNPFIRGNLAFTSYYHDGIQVWDLSDPENVTNAGYYDTYLDNTDYEGFIGNWGVYPFLPSGNLIVSDMTNGLFMIGTDSLDLSPTFPPANPDVAIDLDGLSTICEGESVTVFLPEGADDYSWYLNGLQIANDTSNVSIDQAGEIYATAANGHCTLTSDTLTIEVQPLPDPNLTVDDTVACAGEIIILKAQDGYDSYQWNTSDFPLPGEVGPNLEVTESGMYSVKISSGICSVISEEVTITFLDPIVPELSFDGMILTSTQANAYQWYLNGELIEGAVGLTFDPVESGAYQVETVDENGCVGLSSPIEVDLSGTLTQKADFAIQLWPNPAEEQLNIQGIPNQGASSYRIFASDGRVVQEGILNLTTLSISQLPKGVYLLQVVVEGRFGTQTFLVE